MEKITETVKIQIDELLAEKDMILVAIILETPTI